MINQNAVILFQRWVVFRQGVCLSRVAQMLEDDSAVINEDWLIELEQNLYDAKRAADCLGTLKDRVQALMPPTPSVVEAEEPEVEEDEAEEPEVEEADEDVEELPEEGEE